VKQSQLSPSLLQLMWSLNNKIKMESNRILLTVRKKKRRSSLKNTRGDLVQQESSGKKKEMRVVKMRTMMRKKIKIMISTGVNSLTAFKAEVTMNLMMMQMVILIDNI